LNLKNVIGYQNKLALEKNPKNFYNTILRYNQFKSESITEAENSLFKSSISNFGLDLVKNRTIDVFPWELSYVAKNKLNWKPRPTLQAGAYNKDIDKISSKYFTKAFGPDFLLFHLSADHNLTNLGSIDNRYILNDEPLSIYEIFKNYKFEHKEKDFLILSKSDTSLLNNPVDGVINTLSRNTWINVPEINNKIIRLKFYYDKKIFAVLKELLIKGDIFYIEYKLTNNEIYKYRFNPETAQSGLWVSPFINDINSNSGYKVKSIRFSCSNSFLYKPQFHFQWQFIEIIDNNILNNKIPVKELKQEYILKSKNTFESSDRYWNTNPKSVTSVNSYSGKYSNYLPAKSYSSTFITEINEIQTESDYVTVLVKCNSLLLRKSRPIVAISVEKDGTSKFWSSKELESKFKNTWCENQFRWRINISDVKDYTLKVYVWNPKGNKCFIDDFAVEIF
jgi:hypothetical protein